MHNTAARFSVLASLYAQSESHAAGDDLQLVERFAAPTTQEICLDVACGTGHTTFQIARHARFVIGYDLSSGMIKKATALAKERGVSNVLFLLGSAQEMPFAAASFDLVTCRIAPHHFEDVDSFLREAMKALIPGGRIVIEDSLAPADADAANFLERVEKWRDPTHVHSLSEIEWKTSLEEAGFVISQAILYEKKRSFASWVQRSLLSPVDVAALTAAILEAPSDISDVFFVMDRRRGIVETFVDQKLIVRAEKR